MIDASILSRPKIVGMSQGGSKRPKTRSPRRVGRKFLASEVTDAVLGGSTTLFEMGYEVHNTWAFLCPAAVVHLCSHPQESYAFDQGCLDAELFALRSRTIQPNPTKSQGRQQGRWNDVVAQMLPRLVVATQCSAAVETEVKFVAARPVAL